MRFSSSILAFSLLALVIASPLPKDDKESDKGSSKDSGKSQSKASAAGDGVSVLQSQAYNDFSVSDGTAGQAEQDVNKLFSKIDMNNLASVSAEDLKIIKATHDVAEDAEVQGFNPAIAAATGEEAKALENGKIANKVLKTTATVLVLQIKIAQGEEVDPALLEKEQAKMKKNIQLDAAAAGEAMKGVKFEGST
uniref:Putative secreted effector protein CSEP019 n=1 Tax=Podosphaera xanthii TaxID=135283 RepID=A0A2U7NDI6_9PEZI|nr:putative secreted effector protein CSEP019 [Podosphaera xanthii]